MFQEQFQCTFLISILMFATTGARTVVKEVDVSSVWLEIESLLNDLRDIIISTIQEIETQAVPKTIDKAYAAYQFDSLKGLVNIVFERYVNQAKAESLTTRSLAKLNDIRSVVDTALEEAESNTLMSQDELVQLKVLVMDSLRVCQQLTQNIYNLWDRVQVASEEEGNDGDNDTVDWNKVERLVNQIQATYEQLQQSLENQQDDTIQIQSPDYLELQELFPMLYERISTKSLSAEDFISKMYKIRSAIFQGSDSNEIQDLLEIVNEHVKSLEQDTIAALSGTTLEEEETEVRSPPNWSMLRPLVLTLRELYLNSLGNISSVVPLEKLEDEVRIVSNGISNRFNSVIEAMDTETLIVEEFNAQIQAMDILLNGLLSKVRLLMKKIQAPDPEELTKTESNLVIERAAVVKEIRDTFGNGKCFLKSKEEENTEMDIYRLSCNAGSQ